MLLDIEGTTTPVEFVYQVLFPYARERVRDFLERHSGEGGVRGDLEALAKERAAGPEQVMDLDSAVAYVHGLMDRDRKSTPLKSLQGKIWEEGYRRGELRGQVYPDVPLALARWSQQGKSVAIFSSGSILAQKLLFSSTQAGDLTRFLRAYFDTTTGPKADAESYRRIASALGLPAPQVLFLSDVAAELDAARQAGMHTALCVRPGRPEPEAPSHPVIRTFDSIFP